MKNKSQRVSRGKLLALLLCALLLLGLLPVPGAVAAETGALTVKLKKDTWDRLSSVPEVTLYQIGDADPTSESGWSIYPQFSGYGILAAKTSEDLGDVAKKIGKDLRANGTAGTTKPMTSGQVTFDGLNMGVYLGMVTGVPANLEVTPFIVTIPSRDPQDPNNQKPRMKYDVVVKDEWITSATVRKVWEDGENKDGRRPTTITVVLSDADQTKVTLSAGNNWTATVNNLPMYAGGKEIEYTWRELDVDGYASTAVKDGLVTTITNVEQTEATVKKVWLDGANKDALRPTTLEVTLSDGQTVTLSAANNWTATITGLPKYDNGREITYSWTEAKVNGYAGAVVVNDTVTTLTNVELTEATVKKVWQDDDNKEAKRPEFIEVTLSNGQKVTLNEANGWTATITDLPKYDAQDNEIIYTWTEAKVDGYESTQVRNGTVTTLTNVYLQTATPTPTATPQPTPTPTTELTGKKVWVDDSNSHKTRPDTITVTLYANGTPLKATPEWSDTKSDTWTYTFRNLPAVDENGATITYTVKETPVEGYNTRLSGTTITNELIPKQPNEYTEISGTKHWNDRDNARGIRKNVITVHLLRDGVEIDSRTVTGVNGWTYNFGRLPVDDGYGNKYVYTIREDGVEGYFSRIDGMDLINTPVVPDTPTTTTRTTVTITNRTTNTPTPKFEEFSEEEMDELIDMLDYDTPLWGQLLGTGDETPVYPYVFGGIGVAAVIAAVVFGSKKKRGKKQKSN